jgi:ribonuclease BN (tRNA processing enzyme)
MRQMEANFYFFKAGQGSFYGGRIWSHENHKVYTVVYDCGTSPFISGNSQSLNNEIDLFKNSSRYYPHSDEIDLLFISHLDYDHVSGLKRILTEFKVKNIILPYIEKKQRQFFLVSISVDNPTGDLSLDDYTSFIEAPHTFIKENSENNEIHLYFVRPDGKSEVEYQSYDNDNQSPDVYPRGTINTVTEELTNESNVSVYENDLQFFIQRKWEFTTFVKSVNQEAVSKLDECLKSKLKMKSNETLTLDDIKDILTTKRKEAHKCYTDCIGEINSHGLILLHGPIKFDHLHGRIYSDCELNHFRNNYRYNDHFHDDHHFRNNNPIMLGTLLFGDTSINPTNNPVSFPKAFKDKLVNVHIVQVPHHGSHKNWNFDEFIDLKIGEAIDRWGNRVTSVCNFGFGNKYGHPSHVVLNDLSSTIFLNSQFSRLNIKYDLIHFRR